MKKNGDGQKNSQIPNSEAFKKPLEEGITRLGQYSKEMEEHLKNAEKDIDEIKEDLKNIKEKKLRAINARLDEVVGAEKNDREKIKNIEERVSKIESDIEELKGKVESESRDVKQELEKIKKYVEEKLKEIEESVSNRLKGFEDRIEKEIEELKERVKEAENSAYNAENIAEVSWTIVNEHHKPRLDELEEKVNSIPLAPTSNAKNEIPDIAKKSPPPVQASKQSELEEINRALDEMDGVIKKIEEDLTNNANALGINLKQKEKVDEIEHYRIKGYGQLSAANQMKIRYYTNLIERLKELHARLDVAYDAAMQLATKHNIETPKEKLSMEKTSLEKLTEINDGNIDSIVEKTISEIKNGLALLDKKIQTITEITNRISDG